MSKAAQIRRVLFLFGVAATTLSLGLVLGSYIRPVHSQDYIEQSREGVSWVQWGLSSALLGLLLDFCGRGGWRVLSSTAAVLLLVWWYSVGMTLF